MYIGMFLPVAELPWGDQTFQMLSLVHFQISLVNNKNIMNESNRTQLSEIIRWTTIFIACNLIDHWNDVNNVQNLSETMRGSQEVSL